MPCAFQATAFHLTQRKRNSEFLDGLAEDRVNTVPRYFVFRLEHETNTWIDFFPAASCSMRSMKSPNCKVC